MPRKLRGEKRDTRQNGQRLSANNGLFPPPGIHRIMMLDKKSGLNVNIMATRVMPLLLPQTVNPLLNLEQFTGLLEVRKFVYI